MRDGGWHGSDVAVTRGLCAGNYDSGSQQVVYTCTRSNGTRGPFAPPGSDRVTMARVFH